jgi:hypothetical protein
MNQIKKAVLKVAQKNPEFARLLKAELQKTSFRKGLSVGDWTRGIYIDVAEKEYVHVVMKIRKIVETSFEVDFGGRASGWWPGLTGPDGSVAVWAGPSSNYLEMPLPVELNPKDWAEFNRMVQQGNEDDALSFLDHTARAERRKLTSSEVSAIKGIKGVAKISQGSRKFWVYFGGK